MARKVQEIPEFADVDCGNDDKSPDERGGRVYSQDGSEYGVSLGVYGAYGGDAGSSNRIRVLWQDGDVTKCSTGGILFKNGRWKIC